MREPPSPRPVSCTAAAQSEIGSQFSGTRSIVSSIYRSSRRFRSGIEKGTRCLPQPCEAYAGSGVIVCVPQLLSSSHRKLTNLDTGQYSAVRLMGMRLKGLCWALALGSGSTRNPCSGPVSSASHGYSCLVLNVSCRPAGVSISHTQKFTLGRAYGPQESPWPFGLKAVWTCDGGWREKGREQC